MPIQWPFRPRPESSRSDLWTQCPDCSEMVYNKQLEQSQRVCPKCGHHFRLRVDARLGSLLDTDSFE
ncbi:MAG: acetyl-CoA carboxylase carboxyl transferase subunit beta, partial [Chloroflexota bacterium]|nr:acetyl-CoA carboxylase carboxyl transferase subunit beta [Chloroflexota bacterium]